MEARQSLYGFEIRDKDNRRSDDGPGYNIKQLWQRSHEILALALRGFKGKEIAEILGISPVTVSNTLNSELGMKKLSALRAARDEGAIDVSKRINELAEKALQVYEDIFDNESTSYELKKKTADTVLMDIGGHRAPTKIDSRSINVTATPEEIEEFKRRGIEAMRAAGMLAEVPNEGKRKKVRSLAEESPQACLELHRSDDCINNADPDSNSE